MNKLRPALMIALLFFAAFALLNVIKLQFERAHKASELSRLNEQYSRQLQTNENLKQKFLDGSRDKYVEERARAVLEYAYPDEHIFIDTSGDS